MSAAISQARTEFASALGQIASERGIDVKVIIEAIETAILAAYRKDHLAEAPVEEFDESKFKVKVNPDSGEARIFSVEDGKETDITPAGFGRIAAQTAKQVILQKVREAEKDAVIADYSGKLDTIVPATVVRFDDKNVVVDIGRGQGYMPPEEQMKSEFYRINTRFTVLIKDIRETMRGKTIIVSRADKNLVAKLFEREVPEVSSGAVEIVSIAREAGVRTKIAVASTQEGVDPVGACVGQKGVRVQEVIKELNNEKIDIIQHNEDKRVFLQAALAPAEHLKITLDDGTMSAKVVCPEDQLSLAIGRGGQNARLAAKLTGYKINIKAEGVEEAEGVEANEFSPEDLTEKPAESMEKAQEE